MPETFALSAGRKNKKKLWIAFTLTSSYMVAEAIGGILTGSLALLADACEMAGLDASGLDFFQGFPHQLAPRPNRFGVPQPIFMID